MSKERRTELRETLALPVSIGHRAQGVTRDLSESGAFVETDWDQSLDGVLDLEFTLASPQVRFRFVAQGAVLRTEPVGDRLGVAVQLLATRMEILP